MVFGDPNVTRHTSVVSYIVIMFAIYTQESEIRRLFVYYYKQLTLNPT